MVENGHGNGAHMNGEAAANGNGGAVGTFRVKAGLAQMLKGGVIMGACVCGFVMAEWGLLHRSAGAGLGLLLCSAPLTDSTARAAAHTKYLTHTTTPIEHSQTW